MKKLHQSFDINSHSTQEKQKRFCRKSPSKSPRESSNKSAESSLSKFYVKNLKIAVSGQTIERVLSHRIQGKEECSPRIKGREGGYKSQMEIEKKKEKRYEIEQKQKKDLMSQLQKYREYTKKQKQKFEQMLKKTKDTEKDYKELQAKAGQYEQRIKYLEQQVKDLNNKILEKDILLDMLQKQKSSLNRVKTSIHQTRTIELQRQKEQLSHRVTELERQIKNNQLKSQINSSVSTASSGSKSPSKYNKENIEHVYQELHKAQEEVKKLQISQISLQRKYFSEIEIVREKKQKEYDALKKKFSELLGKYKVKAKKIAAEKIQCFREGLGRYNAEALESGHRRSNSAESIDSLVLSQDQ